MHMTENKSNILSQSYFRRRSLRFGLAVAAASFFAVVTAFGTVPEAPALREKGVRMDLWLWLLIVIVAVAIAATLFAVYR